MNKSRTVSGFLLYAGIIVAVFACSSTPPSSRIQTASYATIDSSTYIEIKRVGQKFSAGANPVIRDFLEISNDGSVLFVIEQMYTGRREMSKSLSRKDLEKLAQFIMEQGFFEMEDIYDCRTAECEYKKRHYPPATPVTISVSMGSISRAVKVTVLDKEVLDYPEGFDTILDRLNALVELEE